LGLGGGARQQQRDGGQPMYLHFGYHHSNPCLRWTPFVRGIFEFFGSHTLPQTSHETYPHQKAAGKH
jgi:hypothetical protein